MLSSARCFQPWARPRSPFSRKAVPMGLVGRTSLSMCRRAELRSQRRPRHHVSSISRFALAFRGKRRWLNELRRMGPLIRELRRSTDPLFRRAGIDWTGRVIDERPV